MYLFALANFNTRAWSSGNQYIKYNMKVSTRKNKAGNTKFGFALLGFALAAEEALKCYVSDRDNEALLLGFNVEDACKHIKDARIEECAVGQCYTAQVLGSRTNSLLKSIKTSRANTS